MFKIFLWTNLFCTLLWNFINLFISPKPSPKPSDVQLRHVTKAHLLQKFLDPQKHALIDNILPTGGNLSRFSFTWKMCVVHVHSLHREICIHFLLKPKVKWHMACKVINDIQIRKWKSTFRLKITSIFFSFQSFSVCF